jgi:hypothetical protein
MSGIFAGTLMDKLEADLAQFRKAFNERILYVQCHLPRALFLSIFLCAAISVSCKKYQTRYRIPT